MCWDVDQAADSCHVSLPDHANLLLSALTKLTHLLAARETPPPVQPHLCGTTLLACPSHHPITVGEVFKCLTSKCLAIISRPLAFSTRTPL